MIRSARIALYVQAAFLTLGAVLFLSQQNALAAAEPARSRETAAFFIAAALILLLLVVRRFKNEPQWLLVPIIFTTVDGVVTHVVDLAAQLGMLKTAYDPFLVPLVFDLIVVPTYVLAYRELTGRSAQPSVAKS